MNQVKVLKVAVGVFIFLFLGFGLTLWLTQPVAVYEGLAKVSSALGVEDDLSLEEAGPKLVPVSEDFSLIIPKVSINVPVIADVDGGNSKEYLWRVTQGVAHFKHRQYANVTVDGSLPGEGGNIFLFGHSQIPLGDTSDYQGVFNDLPTLVPHDRIALHYQGEQYEYQVAEGKVISKKDLTYLEATVEETLTLMTCWPLGLDIQRYIVRAKRIAF
ncbi:sortase [Patescibacteria group bacterium]|nr:sortase [Patescibacteria group bacterium]MBU1868397.1 sortase [Patescibacteria group bacterium]